MQRPLIIYQRYEALTLNVVIAAPGHFVPGVDPAIHDIELNLFLMGADRRSPLWWLARA